MVDCGYTQCWIILLTRIQTKWTSQDLPSVTGDMFTDRSTYNMGT